MPTVKIEAQISALDLLQAVEQLSQPELEQFIQQVIQLRAKNIAFSLPTQESELLLKINQGFHEKLQRLYQGLIDKRDRATLTESEYQQLLELTDRVEKYQVQRLEYLTQLAQIRQVSVANLITQLGLKPINND